MLRRIRELMRAPFARTPGRRRAYRLLMPEICAGLVYVAWLLVFLYLARGRGGYGELLLESALWAYGLAAAITLLVPLARGRPASSPSGSEAP